MNQRAKILESLGFPLEKTTPEGDLVEALVVDGLTVYTSGQVPFDGDVLVSRGKVPDEVGVEAATQAAALCAANVLRAVDRHCGLENVERVVRITGYVNASDGFTDAHLVINGASRLVREVLGESGRHARTALGLAQLPLGASVEIEMILKLKTQETQDEEDRR